MIQTGQSINNEIKFEASFKNSFAKKTDPFGDYSTGSDFLAVLQQSFSNISNVTEPGNYSRPEQAFNYSYENSVRNQIENPAAMDSRESFKTDEPENNQTVETGTEEKAETVKDSDNEKKEISVEVKAKKQIQKEVVKNNIVKDKEKTDSSASQKIDITKGEKAISGIKANLETGNIKKAAEVKAATVKTEVEVTELSQNKKSDKKVLSLDNLTGNKKSNISEESVKKVFNESELNKSEEHKISQKTQFKKDSKNIKDQVNENQKIIDVNVSRETIVSIKDSQKDNDTIVNKNFSLKSETPDKSVNLSGLKSELSSDLGSNQNQSGFSTSGAERMASLGKTDDALVTKQNIQQQIDQLLQRAKVVVKDSGNARLSTKLNPKELGEISIKLVLSGGKLSGKVTVESNQVQKELNEKLEQLFNEMRADGFDIEGFEVDVKSQTADSGNSNERFLNVVKNEFNNNFITSSEIDDSIEYNTVKRSGEIYA